MLRSDVDDAGNSGDLDETDVRRRVMGCWLGKAVGGTLGQSFEGLEGPLDFDFYYPIPTQMIPNDDLDLQVLYAVVMSAMDEPAVDRHVIAKAWADHVLFPWNEYGVAQRNRNEGLTPPQTGSFDNWWANGEGAAIRSELWACLAAGNPSLAAAYAYEDACFDHAGDGIWAAVFLAATQSAAFVERDATRLIDIGLSFLPVDSRLRHVIEETRDWVESGLDWMAVRSRIVDAFGSDDMTDVHQNTGFVILGWLAGGGDFSRSITICNNCGEDTDSSTASLGSILGILDPDGIDQKWLDPIGRDLVLNDAVVGIEHPATLDGFTDMVLSLRTRLNGRRPTATSQTIDTDQFAVPVLVSWSTPIGLGWVGRDISGMTPVGAPAPVQKDPISRRLPGTWHRMPASDFEDRLMLIRYTAHLDRDYAVRVMLNSTVEFRLWIDGEFALASPPSFLFPSPHSTPAGHFLDRDLSAGEHILLVEFKRPARPDEIVEWVIGLAERPSQQYIPAVFR